MSLGTTDDDLQEHLQNALDLADGERMKYHLREAMQLEISDTDVGCDSSESSGQ